MDQSMQDDSQGESQEAPDKITVCIEIDADGSISVGMMPDDESESGGGGDDGMTDLAEPDDDSGMRQVPSIKAALQVAGDLLRNASQINEPIPPNVRGGEQQSSADAAFKSVRGNKGGY